MIRSLLTFLFLSFALGCGEPLTSDTPKGAFALLGPCLDNRDAGCLFHRLDRESRWAVCTIHKTLVKMRIAVEASYPEARRGEAYGSWREAALGEDAQAVFVAYCKKKQCLETIAAAFGAVTDVRESALDRAVVTTTRGRTFEMARYDGKWGLALFQKELLAAKLRLIDSVKQVEKNARAFDEQKRATGSSK